MKKFWWLMIGFVVVASLTFGGVALAVTSGSIGGGSPPDQISAKGIRFGVSPSLPTYSQPGQLVTIAWHVTSNLPGKQLIVTIVDLDGLEIERYEENLVGQVEPYDGLWKFVIPPGVETGIWRATGEFYPDSPDYGDRYDASAGIAFGVREGEFSGTVINTIKVVKEY